MSGQRSTRRVIEVDDDIQLVEEEATQELEQPTAKVFIFLMLFPLFKKRYQADLVNRKSKNETAGPPNPEFSSKVSPEESSASKRSRLAPQKYKIVSTVSLFQRIFPALSKEPQKGYRPPNRVPAMPQSNHAQPGKNYNPRQETFF